MSKVAVFGQFQCYRVSDPSTIVNPVIGSIIFNTSTERFETFDVHQQMWVPLSEEGEGGVKEIETDGNTVTPVDGIVQIVGGDGISTSGDGTILTITAEGSIKEIESDGDPIAPTDGVIQIVGGDGISTSGNGNTLTITAEGGGEGFQFIGAGGFSVAPNPVNGGVTFLGSDGISIFGNTDAHRVEFDTDAVRTISFSNAASSGGGAVGTYNVQANNIMNFYGRNGLRIVPFPSLSAMALQTTFPYVTREQERILTGDQIQNLTTTPVIMLNEVVLPGEQFIVVDRVLCMSNRSGASIPYTGGSPIIFHHVDDTVFDEEQSIMTPDQINITNPNIFTQTVKIAGRRNTLGYVVSQPEGPAYEDGNFQLNIRIYYWIFPNIP